MKKFLIVLMALGMSLGVWVSRAESQSTPVDSLVLVRPNKTIQTVSHFMGIPSRGDRLYLEDRTFTVKKVEWFFIGEPPANRTVTVFLDG